MPGNVSLDARLARDVHLKEGVVLQFIGEAFNLFNHANVADVRRTQNTLAFDATACGIAGTPCLIPVRDFGSPVSHLPARIIQLAIKQTF